MAGHEMKVTIAYRKISDANEKMKSVDEAVALRDFLQNDGINVYLDPSTIEEGDAVTRQIVENIVSSDALIILLEPGTHRDNWVQRAVDVARGARVSLIPVIIDRAFGMEAAEASEVFALPNLHTVLELTHGGDGYIPLLTLIQARSEATKTAQLKQMYTIRERWIVQPAPTNQRQAIFAHSDVPGVEIAVAAGDITSMNGIDVIVNSENDYMQMARVFEGGSLSAALRASGAYIRQQRLEDDRVQMDLFQQVTDRASDYFGMPVPLGEIVPTSAGHPQSELVKQGIRYIFHASIVNVVDPHTPRQHFEPLTVAEGIPRTIENCFEMVANINERLGVIAPEGSERHAAQMMLTEKYTPITSMIFPLFATGYGELGISQVADAIAGGLAKSLTVFSRQPNFSLTTIYLNGFTEPNIDVVQAALGKFFQQV